MCVECGKSFHQPSHLRAHVRAHTGITIPGQHGAGPRPPSCACPPYTHVSGSPWKVQAPLFST